MGLSEAQLFAREIINSAEYRESVTRRVKNDKLPAAVENTLLYYAFGKPAEIVSPVDEHGTDLTKLPLEQLAVRAEQLHSMIRLRAEEDARVAKEEADRARFAAEQAALAREREAQALAEQERNVFHKVDNVH